MNLQRNRLKVTIRVKIDPNLTTGFYRQKCPVSLKTAKLKFSCDGPYVGTNFTSFFSFNNNLAISLKVLPDYPYAYLN